MPDVRSLSTRLGGLVFAAAALLTPSLSRAAAADPSAAATVRKADEAWSAAAAKNSVDAWMAFYADDVTLLPPGEAMSSGKAAARKGIAELFSLKDVKIAWKTGKVDVAASANVAYTIGTFAMSWTEKGKPMKDHGKYLEIWKKQADGKWLCSADIWNSDVMP